MMTRDAKIGLLVVLAFCLIVGILLSEHVSSGSVPQQASLAQAGDSARRATSSPQAAAPIAAPATIDADPQPHGPVVTRDVIDAPPTASRIELGRPAGGEMKVIRADAAADAVAGAVQVAVPQASQPPEPTPAVAVAPPAMRPVQPTNAALIAAARSQGVDLVAVDRNARTSPFVAAVAPTPPVALAATPARGGRTKELVAQDGDTLNKMARRALGANTPANRQAIVDLNPSLQKNPERILVGAKYLVPADAWSAALDVADASAVDAAEAKVVAAAAKLAAAEPNKPAVATIAYEVKAGDSLWKLAANDPAAVAQIKALNADVLKGGETVKVGMRLALPAKRKA